MMDLRLNIILLSVELQPALTFAGFNGGGLVHFERHPSPSMPWRPAGRGAATEYNRATDSRMKCFPAMLRISNLKTTLKVFEVVDLKAVECKRRAPRIPHTATAR